MKCDMNNETSLFDCYYIIKFIIMACYMQYAEFF